MNTKFSRRLKKFIFWLLVLFTILFVFRMLYGYTKVIHQAAPNSAFIQNVSITKNNYASKKYSAKSSSQSQSSVQLDQKYEKIASIRTKSSLLDSEEKAIRQKVKDQDGIIQFEQKSGNKGHRMLNLVVGVPPQHFDTLYAQLIEMGHVLSKEITKNDKTNEYKALNAKRKSLEQIRNSLISLKSKGGKIEEYINLENRILDIEQQLQNLGVSLGDFDDENEFCTVKISLIEEQEVKIRLAHRVKVALEWTVKICLRILVILSFVAIFAFFVLLSIEKLRILERIIDKKD